MASSASPRRYSVRGLTVKDDPLLPGSISGSGAAPTVSVQSGRNPLGVGAYGTEASSRRDDSGCCGGRSSASGAEESSGFWTRRRMTIVAVLFVAVVVGAVVAVVVTGVGRLHLCAAAVVGPFGQSRSLSRMLSCVVPGFIPPSYRACLVFCEGPILAAVNSAKLYNDSKTFVDLPLLVDPEEALYNFQSLPKPVNKATLKAFINSTFGAVGSDLLPWVPTDYSASPAFVANIRNASLAQWAQDINGLWLVLGRKVAPDVLENPQRHSLLPLPFPTVVPGGRFRETYYWDTYWIVRGLLVCGMQETAKNVVRNLVSEVDWFGFVPNGARVYYLTRSQPPMLSLMVSEIYNATSDKAFVNDVFPALMQEYNYWTFPHNSRIVTQHNVTLARYLSTDDTPRPESYAEDVATAAGAGFPDPSSAGAGKIFSELRSAAETGWDFSSRWLRNPSVLASIHTSEIIPVDLNAILYRVELTLADFAVLLGQQPVAQDLRDAAADRMAAMRQMLWDSHSHQWYDYNVTAGAPHKLSSVSNFVPIWAGAYDTTNQTLQLQLIQSLKASGLVQPGGIATTTQRTGQQWDWPNAWPPCQHMVIEGLRRMQIADGPTYAAQLAKAWLNTGFIAYFHSPAGRFMYEKYNATEVGHGGGGGEYVPQVGFGWTNGVALDLLNKYGPLWQSLS